MIPTLCPAYLPNVRYFAWMLAQDKVFFVNNTHFQKQTYLNRTEICGSNGILKLTLPTVHSKEAHQKENEVRISDTIPWQKQHWRSICTAYRSSPYFEFYEQDLEPFYNNPSQLLFDFNLKILLQLLDLIECPISFEIIAFDKKEHERLDFLLDAKSKTILPQAHYTQVFEQKNGFIPNLSILDVLFNLGPNTSDYIFSANY